MAPQTPQNPIEIRHLHLVLPRLQPEFSGYRLVQISDIHVDGWMSRQRLAEIVDQVNRLEPELVAATGDFFTHSPQRYADDLIIPLKNLSAPDGVVAVLGNHDHGSGPEPVRAILRQAGVIVLTNTAHTLRRGRALLHLGGVDDIMLRQDRLDLVLDQLPLDGAAILLAHEPDYADTSAASGRFDLQLSGHSHGGQVRLPRIGPIFLPRYARKYPHGQYQVGKMVLYVNRGLGVAHLRLRINCRPEITVITLES
jgi:hypothetical protein